MKTYNFRIVVEPDGERWHAYCPALVGQGGATWGDLDHETAVFGLATTGGLVSTTGIAGPDGGTEAKPVGTVFIALADGGTTVCRPYAFRWERRRNKVMASQAALLMLWRYLSGELRDDG